MRRSAVFLALVVALAAAGEPVLGDGHWGPLNLRYATLTLNRSAALAATGGGSALEVSTTSPFAAGDLVMVYQAQVVLAVDSGTPGPFSLSPTGAGRWELARVAAVDGGTTLALAAPLGSTYPAGMAQVLVVPEYTTV